MKDGREIDKYSFESNNVPINVRIIKARNEFVPIYEVSVANISETTELVLDKIRDELISQVNLGITEIADMSKRESISKIFLETIDFLIEKHFPDIEESSKKYLKSYLVQKSLGLGDLKFLNSDNNLEEIAVNNATEPVWVYHRKHGWLKTNINVESEQQIKHYSAMIGRKVGRQITVLDPLMDANMESGDRVNATLSPVSLFGNTITLRKFASKPWTITDFISSGTISPKAASFIWLAIQYELSALIAGGTASGKTSMLNAISNFFPPNQRIISIEDTHEIRLPKYLHWVPMITRTKNPEGKGEITMLNLLINSLRMRPDRIVVGEIRRKEEAEVLFEAIHTGHSVYATIHANNAQETKTRLVSPPINVPKEMIPAISLIVVQYRNRRTGKRRTFQIAEVLKDGTVSELFQLDTKKDVIKEILKSKKISEEIQLFAGLSKAEIEKDLNEKEKILKWLVNKKINTVDEVGRIMAEFYTGKENLMKAVKSNRLLKEDD
ncbi:MAG TPA: CpaF family protein [Candidatus Woesearchaeota archaeon]|nr:CpaF family protein [Candidatus Woesearchaeota archaeon]